MASSLVRTGFVRGSSTQGNGCYEHRCINQTLEVQKSYRQSNSSGFFGGEILPLCNKFFLEKFDQSRHISR
jgi:hypothetical protein